MLPDPEGDVAADVSGGEDAGSLELGLRRLDEVGGAADHRRGERLQRLHHLPAGIAGRDLLAGREHRQRLAPALTRLPAQVELAFPGKIGERRRPRGDPPVPFAL